MVKSPQTVGEALEQARQERSQAEAKGPEAVNQVVAAQIADALIGIRWLLAGMSTRLSK